MAFALQCHTSLPLTNHNKIFSTKSPFSAPSGPLFTTSNPKFSSIRVHSKSPGSRDPNPKDPLSGNPSSFSGEISSQDSPNDAVADEWGEKSEPEDSYTKLSETDPTKDEDEWGSNAVEKIDPRNRSAVVDNVVDDKVGGLKRCFVDSVDGTNFGFRASSELRAEISELISQLEAANPTRAPVEAPDLLGGKWFLAYTAFSELLPLIAAGSTPLLKLENICQSIDTNNLTIENSSIFSTPLATFSFSASATFEVQTPSRIQVRFKEGVLRPPEIKSRGILPENVDLFGQKLNLSGIEQALGPLSDYVARISHAISGQPPLKFGIPGGDRTQSWLLTTYLDKDLRISRGDGGVFVLVKEGSSLLNP